MATIREASGAAWRDQLVEASFAGVVYHVEQQARNSGRRVVTHEYPKRDEPYAEDMGRHARRYQITGYVIGPDYNVRKNELVNVLENSDGAALIDPYLGGEELTCICERYSVTESRERGGYCMFEMMFVEVGKPGNSITQEDTTGRISNAADSNDQQAKASFNQTLNNSDIRNTDTAVVSV